MRTSAQLLAGVALLAGAISCKGTINPGGGAPGDTDPGNSGSGNSGNSGTSGATGTAGMVGGAAGTGGAAPAIVPFEATSPASYTAKVKNLLTGQPPTADELAAVTTDPKALRALIDTWMATPEFQTKMLVFFRNAFQQAQVDGTMLLDQLGGRGISSNGPALQRLIVNIQESFPRTAWQLVSTGKPWSGTIDTSQYMVTTALASFLGFVDDRFVDDKAVGHGQPQAHRDGLERSHDHARRHDEPGEPELPQGLDGDRHAELREPRAQLHGAGRAVPALLYAHGARRHRQARARRPDLPRLQHHAGLHGRRLRRLAPRDHSAA